MKVNHKGFVKESGKLDRRSHEIWLERKGMGVGQDGKFDLETRGRDTEEGSGERAKITARNEENSQPATVRRGTKGKSCDEETALLPCCFLLQMTKNQPKFNTTNPEELEKRGIWTMENNAGGKYECRKPRDIR